MTPLPFLLLGALLALAPAARARAETVIEGTVTLPPADPGGPAAQERYPAGASYDAGPPDPPAAVVYLEAEVAGGAPPAKAEVAQRRYQFAPGLLPIRRGTIVAFPNLDDEYHSVFSYSKARRFDLGRYRKGEVPAELVFDQAGVVKLFCEIHDHMRGTILVLDTPYFTTTDAAGRFRLTGLPSGRFTLKAWIDESTIHATEVTLPASGTVRVDLPAPSGAGTAAPAPGGS